MQESNGMSPISIASNVNSKNEKGKLYLRQPSNTTSTTGIQSDSTEKTTQDAPSTLKLKDHREITSLPDVKASRVSRQATVSEDDTEIDSTTIESSTLAMNVEQKESSDNNDDTNSPHNNYYVSSLSYLPYPPSGNPSSQHLPIIDSPHHKSYLTPKSFYNFQPSQPDYSHHSYIPYYCINAIYHKFTPIVHDTWPNYYHKWK